MAETVIDVLQATAERRGAEPALVAKRGGTWRKTSWEEYLQTVLAAAGGMIELGLAPRQGVAILGYNRPEWFVSDLAAIAAGGHPTGIYTTLTPEQIQYVLDHSEAAVVVVESEDDLARILPLRERLPRLRAIVLMEGESAEPGVVTWSELVELGSAVPRPVVRRRIEGLGADDLCTLIYTSGTTGPPKGVMLSHRNIVFVGRVIVEHLDIHPGDSIISYLALSHIAEQVVSLHAPIAVGACTWFAESLEKLRENLLEVRPHVFLGVPRVWEKIQAGVAAAGAGASPIKKRLVRWARGKGLAGGYADQRGEPLPRFYGLADRLVFSKVRRRLGLDRARYCATSAAPISLDTLEFFLSLGIPLLEVYGMTECTGPATMCTPERYRTGCAGFTIPGTEIRIAEDGEIQMRGPHVFLGYYKNEEATREALDADGWLHSGDVGALDEDGFLRVTDRKKELIITSGGKNVAPQPIESKLKSIPSVALAAVVGDRRKYLAALLTLDPERLPGEAEAAGSAARDPAAASRCAVFRAYLERQVEAVNRTLANFETLKRFAVLPGQFTIEGGELTPTMKLKRRVIEERYAAEIEGLFA